MDDVRRVIVRIRLEKCTEDLEAARLLFNQGAYRIAISRAYYAIFMLTTAVLLTQDIVRSKHSGVVAAFNQYFIKPGLIEAEYGQIFHRAFKARMDADYSDSAQFGAEQARQAIEDAERFVRRLETYLYDTGILSDEHSN